MYYIADPYPRWPFLVYKSLIFLLLVFFRVFTSSIIAVLIFALRVSPVFTSSLPHSRITDRYCRVLPLLNKASCILFPVYLGGPSSFAASPTIVLSNLFLAYKCLLILRFLFFF